MIAPAKYALSDPTVSTRGAKTCTLDSEGERVVFKLGSKSHPTVTPFGASSFGDEDTPRKGIEFRLTPEQDETFQAFDDWALDYLETHSERILKRKLSREQVVEHYRSPVRRQEGYEPLLRCKVNVSGRGAARCWDEDGLRIKLPDDLRGCALVPRVFLSHLWIMGRDFGFVFNVTDLMVLDAAAEVECPF